MWLSRFLAINPCIRYTSSNARAYSNHPTLVCIPVPIIPSQPIPEYTPTQHVVLVQIAETQGCSISHWQPRTTEGDESIQFHTEDLKQLLQPNTKLVVVNFTCSSGSILWTYVVLVMHICLVMR